MLFFELDFLILFLVPVLLASVILKACGFQRVLPWLASLASFTFLYVFSSISVAIAFASIVLNYFGARYLLMHREKAVFLSVVAVNLAVLAYFKYSILFERTFFDQELSWTWRIALPLGISFYTFQQIAFVSDVYRGTVKSFSLRSYALFKLFFPQFIAGPIVHFERVRASYERWPTFNARSIRFALTIFAIGMVKKLAGDYFGAIANADFAAQGAGMDAYTAWSGMLAFTLQIYFDFSGYSDMAVGLARLFGVSLPFNFNSPYKARNPSDFWRRWHITLSRWLRDYLYISLGGNRRGMPRMVLALFLTMALGGLWHGASWTFLMWGAVHGLALVVSRFVRIPGPAGLRYAGFLFFIALTWVLFRSETFSGAYHHYLALFDFSNHGVGIELRRMMELVLPFVRVGGENIPEQVQQVLTILGALCACIWLPNSQQISLWLAARDVRRFACTELPLLAAAILIISLAYISPDTTNAFIYFQF